jgi:hypothetical protein
MAGNTKVKEKKKEKFLRAFKEVTSCLKSVEDEEDVEDWMGDMGISGEDIKNVRKSCEAISNLLRVKEKPVKTTRQDNETLDQYFVLRQGYRSVILLAPVESLRCNSRYGKKKVLGVLRKVGMACPLKLAFPGWKNCADAHDRLLDSELWAERVLKFAKHIDHRFKDNGFDQYHKKEIGASYASHVEPKLMLFFACRLFVNRVGEPLNLRKLHLLRRLQSGTEAEIIVSEEPCTDCKKFQEVIELVTGLKFKVKVCQNLGILKRYRNDKGAKIYQRYPTESPELDEEDVLEQFSPPKESKSNIMVMIKSSAGMSDKTTAEIHVTSVAKREPRRRKRQYEEDDDNEDYYEEYPRKSRTDDQSVVLIPRTRARVRSSIGVMTPAASFPHKFIRLN